MLTPKPFTGSTNQVVDKMSQNPLSGGRLPIWDDNARTQDVDFSFYIAKPGADGILYGNELTTMSLANPNNRAGFVPGAVNVSTDRSVPLGKY